MDPETKQLLEDRLNVINELREKHDAFAAGAMTKADFKEFEQKVWQRVDQLDARLNRPIVGTGEGESKSTPEKKAFENWIRKGVVTPDEAKVMTIADPTTGGYLAPPEYVNEIIKGIVDFSPLRTVARIRTTRNRSVQIPKKTQSTAASWVGETGTRSETQNIKVALEEIPAHELYALTKITTADLEDSAFNLESEINLDFSEQFGVAEGTAFITGNKVGKPEGVLSNTEVLAGKIAGDTSGDLSATDILNTFYGLKDPYARNATWLMKRATVQKVALLKDPANHYIWLPNLVANQPDTILGRPILECPDMPTVAANAYSVAFGDFRRGYIIIDRLVIETLRDPFSSKSSGCIEFSARKRVGGQVVLAEAIKVLQIKA